jgi:uncharacterized protein (UPF0261 family)
MTAAGAAILVIGTMDTKAAELIFLCDALRTAGHLVRVVDVSTSAAGGGADVAAAEVAACHPDGADAVFCGVRGEAVAAMSVALVHWIGRQDVAGAIGIGGSGGTALIAPALRSLPFGLPKLIVSTVASGNTAAYIGTSDLILIPSVTDLAGLNRVSRRVLAHAAAALGGMVAGPQPAASDDRRAIGLTMFGVTTTCVTEAARLLGEKYDSLIFHATGAGGDAMEDLAIQGHLDGILDLTTTELCDRLAGGIMPAGPDRIARLAPLGRPYVASVGATDMVNFASPESVPNRYRDRLFHRHNPQITLMRTTPAETAEVGTQIAAALNRFTGPAAILLPESGVSALDQPGKPFHHPAATAALFNAIETHVIQGPTRQVLRLPHHINDPAFAAAAVATLERMMRETLQ